MPSVSTSLTIQVLRAQPPTSWDYLFTVTVRLQPQGLAARLAQVDEVTVYLQNRGTGQAVAAASTASNGVATMRYTMLPANLGQYRLVAQHPGSGAEQARDLSFNEDGSLGPIGAEYLLTAGNQMPATFTQERPAYGFAFPEARSWPTSGPNTGLPGVRIRVRQSLGPLLRAPTV